MSDKQKTPSSKQVIVMRKDLNMRKGKMIAQGAHASLAAYKKSPKNTEEFKTWDEGSFTKITVSVDSEEALTELFLKAKSEMLNVALIIDSGRTEFNGEHTMTCLCIGPHWSDRIDAVTGHLSLL